MKFSMIFEGVDKASKVMKKLMTAEKKMAAATNSKAARAQRANQKTQTGLSRLSRGFAKMSHASKAAFKAIIQGAKLATRQIGNLHRKTVSLAKNGLGNIGHGFGRAKKGIMTGLAGLTILYGSAGLAAGSLVGTASEFERFETILQTTEGSATAAKQSMNWIQDFAVTTPYELNQVTDAFVKLRAYGLDPTQGLLRTLGDTSAAMGKPLEQAVEAIADAVTGENERLKEFGIKASKSGSRITYEYTNAAGKMEKATVKASDRVGIQMKLMEIMNAKYAGSMDRLSGTWEGMVSNLMDQWAKFQLMIMDAGLYDWMKGKLGDVLETINQMEADGRLQAWAKSISETIQSALKNMWAFGVRAWAVFKMLSDYLKSASDYVGGAYLIYQNWDAIEPYFIWVWDGIKSAFSAAWDFIKAAFGWTPLGIIINNWEGVSKALVSPFETGKELISQAWEKIKAVFADWVPDFGRWTLPELDSSLLTGTWDMIKALFEWSPLEAIEKNFGPIGENISGFVSGAAEKAGAAWNKLISIFSSDEEDIVKMAISQPQSIDKAVASTEKLKTALDAVNTVMDQLNTKMAKMSWHNHGLGLINTLAAGILAGRNTVVAAVESVAQSMRDHLPSSPAKTGPLSDIHNLKFAETIAGSIHAGPMVKAMRAATAATMAVAGPVATTSPASAAVAKSAAVTTVSAQYSAPGVTINFNPTLNLSGSAKNLKQDLLAELKRLAPEIGKIVDEEIRRQSRRKH